MRLPDAPTINEVDTNATEVNGTAEPNSTVTVTFPDGTTTTGTADDQGIIQSKYHQMLI